MARLQSGKIPSGGGSLSPSDQAKLDYLQSAVSGLTASTTQTQGQGALTSRKNYVDTVANSGDTVTLGSLGVGDDQYVENRGANPMSVFPASGQDLGEGANTATTVHPGEFILAVCEATNTINLKRSRAELTLVELTGSATITAGQMYGTHFVHTTGVQTMSLPAVVSGMNITGEVNVAAVITIDPNGSEVIVLDGVTQTGGVTIVSDGTVDCMYSASCLADGTISFRTKGFSTGS